MSAAEPRRCVLVVFDGLGDLPSPALDGLTPLEAAATPFLDRLVERGRCGLVDPLEPGVVVETHAGTAPLFGMAPEVAATLTRGPIEAAGAGLELRDGDVALRCNFATLDAHEGGLAIRDRRAGRIREGTEVLAAAVNALPPIDGVTMLLAPLGQHRAALRLSGRDLSAAVADTDPGAGVESQRVRACTPLDAQDADAVRTADVLERFLARAQGVLAAHPVNVARIERGLPPANGLLVRGAGRVQDVGGLARRVGLRGAVVSGDRTVLGLGALLGLEQVVRPEFTGLLDTDLDAKVAAVRAALATNDVVWLHLKGTDIAAHDRQPLEKRAYLERADAALASLDADGVVLGVTADHSTDSNTGCHTSDPVPSLLYGPGGPRDACTAFGESTCADGGLGRLSAAAFLRRALDLAGLVPLPVDGAGADGGRRRGTDA